jgi:hypothetical protein
MGNPFLYILQHDWRGVDVQTAETMAFVTLSLASCSAPTPCARSAPRSSSIGVFSNKYMQYAVGASIFLLLHRHRRALPPADLQHALPDSQTSVMFWF